MCFVIQNRYSFLPPWGDFFARAILPPWGKSMEEYVL
jgi:hypothetical protein